MKLAKDIAKCVLGCKKQATCLRWVSEPDEYWQAYGRFDPDENGECEFYMELKDGE